MHNLRHFYYQNKSKIWKIILLTILMLGLIYILNEIVGSGSSQPTIAEDNNAKQYFNNTTNVFISNKEAISGSTITKNETKKIDTTIGNFLDYCNSGKIEQAYKMLSDSCKEKDYKTIQDFQETYIKRKFQGSQSYSIKKWEENTYQVELKTDILSTGTLSNESSIVEYITIVNQNGENKLNINNYIGNEKLNKKAINKNIEILAIEKDIYMDYETYKFKIKNNSNKTIKLDSLNSTGTVYLKDSNNNKYKSAIHEVIEEEMIIDTKRTIELEIKFINPYMSSKDIKKIIFEDVILDYNKYIKENIKDAIKIELDM